ncbi:MAG TPA: tRNA (adenosine(37)-N6)-dimethylallyltransferase MiaA [Bacillota bacterium]|nr:tRNA (adenosine(37)-N6)-dimethylallyltransferase MiaA [Bacillota bacterium]
MLPNVIIIVGPTAIGKTAVGIDIAKLNMGEVISADSMLVYRGMDIGTAKPAKDEMQGIPHHMIDLVNPDEEFTVAMFQARAEELIKEIAERGKAPVVVGGTGLYIRSLTETVSYSSFAVDWEYRKGLNDQANELGSGWLHSQLEKVDPVAAERIHPNDQRRIVRALEVYHFTGKPISYHWKQDQLNPATPKYHLKMYGLTLNRAKLYERINLRVDQMLTQGLVQEVSGLLDRGYSPELVSMKGLGYKEIAAYLRGVCSLEEAVETIKQSTRRFAKRQMTWFRREQNINWIDVEQYDNSTEIAKEILSRIAGQLPDT